MLQPSTKPWLTSFCFLLGRHEPQALNTIDSLRQKPPDQLSTNGRTLAPPQGVRSAKDDISLPSSNDGSELKACVTLTRHTSASTPFDFTIVIERQPPTSVHATLCRPHLAPLAAPPIYGYHIDNDDGDTTRAHTKTQQDFPSQKQSDKFVAAFSSKKDRTLLHVCDRKHSLKRERTNTSCRFRSHAYTKSTTHTLFWSFSKHSILS